MKPPLPTYSARYIFNIKGGWIFPTHYDTYLVICHFLSYLVGNLVKSLCSVYTVYYKTFSATIIIESFRFLFLSGSGQFGYHRQGLTGSGFWLRDGTSTCKKVWVPGQIGTGTEKILMPKITYEFPQSIIIDHHIHLFWNRDMNTQIDGWNTLQIVTILMITEEKWEWEFFL